ncbi:MAG: anthranilate phosphoribosyltransferase [Pyrinomonadaceae bacterium]
MSLLEHYTNEFQNGSDLAVGDAADLFNALITEADADSIVKTLQAWNKKGWSEDELFAFADIMRRRMIPVKTRHGNVIDIVGTGGSAVKTFNVSTAAAFVIAGAGVAVAKHGNRAASSRSGSADVLEAMDIDIDIIPEQAEQILNEVGICFLYARRYHSLSPTLAAARSMVGAPTIFNNLGPLVNPASVPFSVIGVWRADLVATTARALGRLGTRCSWIVHAKRGLDEVDLAGPTLAARIVGDDVDFLDIDPEEFGLDIARDELPSGCSPAESADIVIGVLENRLHGTAAEQIVLANAATALHVAGAAPDLVSACELAEESLRSGSAAGKLHGLVEATRT